MSNFFADYLASWATLDLETVMAFFTDDIVYRDMTIGHGASGIDEMRGGPMDVLEVHRVGRILQCDLGMDGFAGIHHRHLRIRPVVVGRVRRGQRGDGTEQIRQVPARRSSRRVVPHDLALGIAVS